MPVSKSLIDLIGNTPMLVLNRLCEMHCKSAKITAKIEAFNPAGSAKDRIGCAMILDAEKRGILKAGATIIEPTSGNTGIGLASVAAARGYKLILTMPESMSIERRNLLKAYGAELVLTDASKGMQGAVDKAEELAKQIEGSFIAGQFTNPANPEIHYKTTGVEIWNDMDGKVDVLVGGFGTGGTISGAGKYLKEQNPNLYIVAVEPAASPLLSEGKAGSHKIQGIGANFIPKTMNPTIADEILTVTNEDAFTFTKEIVRTEGLLVGISSGAAVSAALEVAKREKFKNKNIVVVLPDTGERYLSTGVFD